MSVCMAYRARIGGFSHFAQRTDLHHLGKLAIAPRTDRDFICILTCLEYILK